MEVWNNMPIFAALNPHRMENTEARPPLKRRAYSLEKASDMEKQKVIVYVDGFNFYYGLRKNRWRKY